MSLMTWLRKFVSRTSKQAARPAGRRHSRWDRYQLRLEALENRLAPAVTANVVGTTLMVNLSAAGDTATITGVALSNVVVSGTGLAATPETGFNDIQVADTGAAGGQSVHFGGAGGVQATGNFGGNGVSVTDVEDVFVDTSVSSLFGSVTVTGATTITANSIQVAPSNLSSAGNLTGPGISLSASGAIALNGLIATGGTIISNGAGPGANAATSGSISVTSSGGPISGTGQLATGDATATGTAGQDSAASGFITLSAGGAIQLSAPNALHTGSATVTTPGFADIAVVGNITVTTATKVSSDGGTGRLSVSIGPPNAGPGNVAGTFKATTTGGAGAAGGILVTSPTLLVVRQVTTGAGDIDLETTGNTTDLLVLSNGVTSTSGAVSLTAGRDVDLENQGAVVTGNTTAGAVTVTATAGSIVDASGNNNIAATANIQVSGNNAGVNLTAGANIGGPGGGRLDITFGGTGSDLVLNAVGNDQVNLLRQGAATLDTLTVTGRPSTAQTIDFDPNLALTTYTVTTTAADTTLSNVTTTGVNFSYTAAAGNLIVGVVNTGATNNATLSTPAGSLVDDGNPATGITAATVTLTTGAAGSIGVGGVADIQTTATAVNATAGSGGVFITEADGADFTATATGAGAISLTSTSGTLNIAGASGTGSGAITLSSGDDITISAALGGPADSGTITIHANTDGVGTQGFAQNSGGSIQTTNATAGAVAVTVGGTGNAFVRAITAGAAGSKIDINAGGSVVDDGVNTTQLGADTVSLTAGGEIGQPGAIAQVDTAATSWTLSAGNLSGLPAHGMWVTDADGVTVTSATTTDGVIVLGAGGTMTATAVTANNVAVARVVALTTTSGDIQVGLVQTAGPVASNIRLTAAGTVTDNNGAAANVITAGGLGIQAGTGIGAADALETQVATLAATSTTGDIAVSNTGSLTTSGVTVLVVPVNNVTASAGNVTLGATGALTLTQPVTASGVGKTAALTAGTNITQTVIATTVTAETVALSAATTAAGTIGTGAQSLVIAATNLSTTTAANNGNQFLNAANPVTATSLDAGTANLTLTGGTFNLAATGTAISDSSNLVVSSPAVVNLASADETIGSLAGDGTVHFAADGANHTLTAGNANSTTFSGSLTGNDVVATVPQDTFTKQGTGTLTLSGAGNSFTGGYNVLAGKLLVTGTIAASSRHVVLAGLNATLGGTGTINRAVDLANTDHLAPGTSPGILNTGSLNFAAGSAFDVEIGGTTAGTGYDQDNVTGTVTLDTTGAGVALNLTAVNAFTPAASDAYIIINNDGVDAVTGTFVAGTGIDAVAPGTPLAEGALLSNSFLGSGQKAFLTYHGGDGNDVAIVVQGPATFTGTAGNDIIELRHVTGGGVDNLQLLLGGVVVDSRPTASVTSYTVNGGDGNDTFIVNYFGGSQA